MSFLFVPLAPPFGFKGELGKELKAKFGSSQVVTISSGECIRQKIASDSEFAARHGVTVEKGGYVPFHEVLPLIKLQLQEVSSTPVVWLDGVCREADHVDQLWSAGILNDRNVRLLQIKTSLATCRDRWNFSKAKGDRETRSDNDVFEDRYHRHYQEEPRILDFFSSRGVKPAVINGNREPKALKACVMLKVRDVIPFPHSVNLQG